MTTSHRVLNMILDDSNSDDDLEMVLIALEEERRSGRRGSVQGHAIFD